MLDVLIPPLQSMIVFGERVFQEVIKVIRCHWGGPEPNVSGVLIRRGE